jgi:ribosomal 50S subunit-recycling heat shock protein
MLSYERLTTAREDDWLAEHRFSKYRAFTVALTVVNRLRVNGYTVAQVLRGEHLGTPAHLDSPGKLRGEES